MLSTVEMRWFFSSPPKQVERMFVDEIPMPVRTDWYSFPCDERCGVKIREGRLEAKLMIADLGTRKFASLAGRLNAWSKWSLEFPSTEPPPTETTLSSAGWVAVTKSRRLRRFEINADEIKQVADRPTNGCEFELTELTIQLQDWWTVGFEAVGSDQLREDNLRQLAIHLFDGIEGLNQFSEQASFSYPTWLNKVAQTPSKSQPEV